MSKGKVWLVGAGPGDRGLLTIRGRELLEQAETVVYDSLVGDGILAMIPAGAEVIDAGKRSGNHTIPQEEMNRILLEKALEGKRVVRLKGGDPFMFGRGGEELELLVENEVPFEVVPGITSPIAVPSYNGIPVTHRDFVSSLHIITAHRKAGTRLSLDFETLAKIRETLLFLMGVSALPEVCQGLLAAGMDPDMPAALLIRGTTARQDRVEGTLGTLEAKVLEAKEAGKTLTPGIIMVGPTACLSEKFGWYEKLPLFGYKILITRPRGMASVMSGKLRAQGAEVLEIPAIDTVPIKDNVRMNEAIHNLADYQWIAFTSPSGVRIFFEEMQEAGVDIRSLYGCRVAALGSGTAAELKKRNLIPDVIPEEYNGGALGQAIAVAASEGDRILLPRAAKGNPEIIEALAGYAVDDIPLYDTVYCKSPVIDETRLINEGGIDCVVFTSSSTVKAFAEANPDADPAKFIAACIGRQTEAAAAAAGMRTVMAKKANMDSVVELVEELCRK